MNKTPATNWSESIKRFVEFARSVSENIGADAPPDLLDGPLSFALRQIKKCGDSGMQDILRREQQKRISSQEGLSRAQALKAQVETALRDVRQLAGSSNLSESATWIPELTVAAPQTEPSFEELIDTSLASLDRMKSALINSLLKLATQKVPREIIAVAAENAEKRIRETGSRFLSALDSIEDDGISDSQVEHARIRLLEKVKNACDRIAVVTAE